MKILIDTNILLRLDDSLNPHHAQALAAVERLKSQGHDLTIVPQVLCEFWAVATRPLEVNGLGLDPFKADDALREWMTIFRLLLDERGVFRHWRRLVADYQVRGKNAHDARLVAAMQRHDVTHLLTFNAADFARFPAIIVQTPADVLAGPLPAS